MTSSVEDRIEELDNLILLGEKHKECFDSLEFNNIEVAQGFLGELGVCGEIKNKSKYTLTSVEVVIYFLDKDDKAVFEKTYYPVNSDVPSYSGKQKGPLKPNYSIKWGCKADDAPSDWAKKVRIEITNIEFEK